ncbi:glycogen/starch/alpha-glucan phosphorylase, partial [Streptococcus pneumoniae]|nr:glycogen/starch/alpha-glucan phosphorylase [Streptococcus pneumoniae]
LEREHNTIVDPDSIFDIHIKRIHGYKRQLMNILHVQQLYKRIKTDPNYRPYPRTFLFGGKSAPSYHFAKQVIKLINTVAERV